MGILTQENIASLKTRLLFLLFLSLCITYAANAQISFSGQPASFDFQWETITLPVKEVRLNADVTRMIADDAASRESHGTPPMVARALPTSIDLSTQGIWTSLEDGNFICRLRVRSEGALALMFSYSDFYIPTDGALYIYNVDRTHLLGAYKHETNPDGGAFATEMVAGDDVVFEYVTSIKQQLPRIVIDAVGYCYNNISVYHSSSSSSAGTRRVSASCMININCEEGADWQTEKLGVARILLYNNDNGVRPGWYLCTGSLINNTRQDLTPYLISAHHCYEGADPENDLFRWIFYFNYESTGCADEEPLSYRTMTGCRVRAEMPLQGGSDGLLIELSQSIPPSWGLYYNGWDRRNEVVAGVGVNIHHPAGDIKKISTFSNYSSSTWNGEDVGATGAHWYIIFDQTVNGTSVTEGGSSGSPMFTSEHLIAGTLTGGNSSCTYFKGSNIYGKMWYHWDQHPGNEKTQMKTWLDPLNTGVEVLEGTMYSSQGPRIEVDQKEMVFYSTEQNVPGDIQTLHIAGYNLSLPIKVSIEGDFRLSTDGVEWVSELTLPAEGADIWVCYIPEIIGDHVGKITFSHFETLTTPTVNLTASSCPQFLFDKDIPYGMVNEPYTFSFDVSGGKQPYSYEIISGNLPKGLSLTEEGVISGTLEEQGVYNFLLQVADSNGCKAMYSKSLFIGCGLIDSFPYQESFESSSGLPECWMHEYVVGDMDWIIQNREVIPFYDYPLAAVHGTNNAFFNHNNVYEIRITKLVTPRMDLSVIENPKLSFWMTQRLKLRYQDRLTMYYRNSVTSDWILLKEFGEDIPNWQKMELELPQPSSEYFIAFEGMSENGYGIGIDDITVYAGDATGLGSPIYFDDMQLHYESFIDAWLNLKWDLEVESITIINAAGERVYAKNGLNESRELAISTQQWSSGVYLVKLRYDTSTHIVRVVKK